MKFSNSYPLPSFQSRNQEKIKTVISRYPLATLITQEADWPTVSQVPLVLSKASKHGDTLLGHFDRNNPHCEALKRNKQVYCIFNGPNHYISPTIYPDEQYPGWNLISAHVKGHVEILDKEEELREILFQTAEHNEPKNSGYTLTADQKNFDIYIKMILGFRINIVDSHALLKLAQDKGTQHAQIAKGHLNEVMKKDLTDFLEGMLRPED